EASAVSRYRWSTHSSWGRIHMSWLWWILIAVGVAAVIGYLQRGSKGQVSAREQLLGPVVQQRDLVSSELDKVVQLITQLPVVAPAGNHSGTLTGQDISRSVSNFMQGAAMIGVQTSTKMLHVVTSPTWVTVILKLKPTRPEAVVREFTRIGDDTWAYISRSSQSMDVAIQEAEARL
ncbi:MAG TPA: hypothetical protein VFQ76_05055, partial [Longimicrobiaceae bacterium]|nr:hypothetical protein [Longimicrobiaceae bacterium]